MHDHNTNSGGGPAVPRAFVAYTAIVGIAATALYAALNWLHSGSIPGSPAFWMLSAFTLGGELLPIPVPRTHGLDKVTISTAFAFALLLRFGPMAATIVYVLSAAIACAVERMAPVKIVFNAAQYALSMLAAAAVLQLAGHAGTVPLTGAEIPLIAGSGLVFFLSNHVLAGVGAALLMRRPALQYLTDDMGFQAWTAGCLLAFTPSVLASLDASIAYVPMSFVPMLAIYFGGRQAALNSHRALHDQLTDLPNRVMLTESLNAMIAAAERDHGMVAVMIIDLDDFKAINDTLGHESGDIVLRELAPRLADAVGADGMLARLGGDEFAVVLRVASEDEAVEAAKRMLASLDRPMLLDTLALHVAGSVGIACCPQHGRTVRELLRHADIALYTAKNSDDAHALYADEQDEYSLDRLALAAQLRRGLERGEVIVHYQLKAPLANTGACGVEALARWNHPQLGQITPEGFIPLAEQTGLIKPLTDRVLEAAVEQCDAWRRQGIDVRVSVNISTRCLLDHDLPASIRSLLNRFQLPSRLLQLEITESRIVADVGRARAVLEDLRSTGVTIAIDDFGTGFSSLSQLQQLPVDEIKIDRSFVQNMETEESDAVLVRSIIELGRSLGLRVTAEGVESESVKRALRGLGCDFVQGFHIGRPVAAAECRRQIEATNAAAPLVLEAGNTLVHPTMLTAVPAGRDT
jgi:diguanylate cyclase (GGDEF)-like protein